jgi:D-sedoheptulose 7-phosphate isomerase
MDEATGFLYPFIEGDERDSSVLLADLSRSAQEKISESLSLRAATLEQWRSELAAAAAKVAHRLRHGGRVFTFGNGGSATDADATAALFRAPPRGRPLPALSLDDDQAVLTALSNDVGFDLVFSRQLIAHGRAGDVAIGFSTSGGSGNVLRAFEEARRRDMLTIGFSGYAGGAMAQSADVDHCFVVPSDSVHRIQETQSALMFELWCVVQDDLAEESTHA